MKNDVAGVAWYVGAVVVLTAVLACLIFLLLALPLSLGLGLSVTLGVALLVSVALLPTVMHGAYLFGPDVLSVRGRGRYRRISYGAVLQVDHVRVRNRGEVRQGVEISYRSGPFVETVVVHPQDVLSFIDDLIVRCPQLTEFAERKVPHLSTSDFSPEEGPGFDRKVPLLCF